MKCFESAVSCDSDERTRGVYDGVGDEQVFTALRRFAHLLVALGRQGAFGGARVLVVRIGDRAVVVRVELLGRAEDAWIDEVAEVEELLEVVLDGCARHDDLGLGPTGGHRLDCLVIGSLEGVTLIADHKAHGTVPQELRQRRAKGGGVYGVRMVLATRK